MHSRNAGFSCIYTALGVVVLLHLALGCRTTQPPKRSTAAVDSTHQAGEPVSRQGAYVDPGAVYLPGPIGSLKAIRDSLRYPPDALEAGIEGRVIVNVWVDTTGRPHDIEIVQGLCPSCDAEAIRVIEQTGFTPGKEVGYGRTKVIPMKTVLPIDFVLPREAAAESVGRRKQAAPQNAVVLEQCIDRQVVVAGGLGAIRDSLRYPADALEAGIEGTVYVSFTVGEDGRPHDPKSSGDSVPPAIRRHFASSQPSTTAPVNSNAATASR